MRAMRRPTDNPATSIPLNAYEKWLQIETDVKKALEKQFPKKPYDMKDWYECPECKEIIAVFGKKPNYCPECGQKIDWRNSR